MRTESHQMPHGRVVSTCTDVMEEIIALGNKAEMYIAS